MSEKLQQISDSEEWYSWDWEQQSRLAHLYEGMDPIQLDKHVCGSCDYEMESIIHGFGKL